MSSTLFALFLWLSFHSIVLHLCVLARTARIKQEAFHLYDKGLSVKAIQYEHQQNGVARMEATGVRKLVAFKEIYASDTLLVKAFYAAKVP